MPSHSIGLSSQSVPTLHVLNMAVREHVRRFNVWPTGVFVDLSKQQELQHALGLMIEGHEITIQYIHGLVETVITYEKKEEQIALIQQQLAPYLPSHSLADELIAERREESTRE